MESDARKRLQIPFEKLEINKKFQMVNNVMKAAIPGSSIFTKVDAIYATNGVGKYAIRPDWPVEIVDG